MERKKLQKIRTIGGDIFVFEGHRIDFQIRRVYFTKNVPEGETRGHHAHKNLEQVLLCPHGAIQVTLDDGKGKPETVTLKDPEEAIYVGPGTWHKMKWLEKGSVLLVLASKEYDEDDYIRDYGDFIRFREERDKLLESRE